MAPVCKKQGAKELGFDALRSAGRAVVKSTPLRRIIYNNKVSKSALRSQELEVRNVNSQARAQARKLSGILSENYIKEATAKQRTCLDVLDIEMDTMDYKELEDKCSLTEDKDSYKLAMTTYPQNAPRPDPSVEIIEEEVDKIEISSSSLETSKRVMDQQSPATPIHRSSRLPTRKTVSSKKKIELEQLIGKKDHLLKSANTSVRKFTDASKTSHKPVVHINAPKKSSTPHTSIKKKPKVSAILTTARKRLNILKKTKPVEKKPLVTLVKTKSPKLKLEDITTIKKKPIIASLKNESVLPSSTKLIKKNTIEKIISSTPFKSVKIKQCVFGEEPESANLSSITEALPVINDANGEKQQLVKKQHNLKYNMKENTTRYKHHQHNDNYKYKSQSNNFYNKKMYNKYSNYKNHNKYKYNDHYDYNGYKYKYDNKYYKYNDRGYDHNNGYYYYDKPYNNGYKYFDKGYNNGYKYNNKGYNNKNYYKYHDKGYRNNISYKYNDRDYDNNIGFKYNDRGYKYNDKGYKYNNKGYNNNKIGSKYNDNGYKFHDNYKYNEHDDYNTNNKNSCKKFHSNSDNIVNKTNLKMEIVNLADPKGMIFAWNEDVVERAIAGIFTEGTKNSEHLINPPRCEFSWWRNCFFNINCADCRTRQLLIKGVDRLPPLWNENGCRLAAVRRDSFKTYQRVQLIMDRSLSSYSEFLRSLERQNPELNVSEWRFFDGCKHDFGGVLLTFFVDGDSFKVMSNNDGYVYYGLGRLLFDLYPVHILDKDSYFRMKQNRFDS